jgi:S-adenosylmethionine decarboxylase
MAASTFSGNFESTRLEYTLQNHSFQEFIEAAVREVGLNQVGAAWHNLEGGGFTGVLCLAESHLSIHTLAARALHNI